MRAGDAFHQGLDLSAARLESEQARLDHAGVVEYQHVAWMQELQQVDETVVVQLLSGHAQQAACGALWRRELRDQFIGQLVVEVLQAERHYGAVSVEKRAQLQHNSPSLA